MAMLHINQEEFAKLSKSERDQIQQKVSKASDTGAYHDILNIILA